MRVQVTAVEQREARPWVAFAADVGAGCGWWRATEAPVVGGRWHVELEFPEPVGEVEVRAPGTAPSLVRDGGVVTVTAHVVAVDDGVVTASLGGDVVLLELTASPGDCVTFAVPAIDVYPYDL